MESEANSRSETQMQDNRYSKDTVIKGKIEMNAMEGKTMDNKESHSASYNPLIRKVFEQDNVDVLLTTLELFGLTVWKEQEKNQEKRSSYDRSSIRFYVHGEDEDQISKLLIDLTVGQPSLDTIYDAVYGFGRDCKERIILFSDYAKHTDHRNMVIIKKMVENLNDFGKGIWLAEVQRDGKGIEVHPITYPTSPAIPHNPKAPSREKFIEAEFWLKYFGEGTRYKEWSEYDFDFNTEFSEWKDINNIRLGVQWTDDGAMFFASDQNDYKGHLQKIWSLNLRDITQAFKGCEVNYSSPVDKPPTISVRVWKEPISILIGTRADEKKGYADLLYAKFRRFADMMQDFL